MAIIATNIFTEFKLWQILFWAWSLSHWL